MQAFVLRYPPNNINHMQNDYNFDTSDYHIQHMLRLQVDQICWFRGWISLHAQV